MATISPEETAMEKSKRPTIQRYTEKSATISLQETAMEKNERPTIQGESNLVKRSWSSQENRKYVPINIQLYVTYNWWDVDVHTRLQFYVTSNGLDVDIKHWMAEYCITQVPARRPEPWPWLKSIFKILKLFFIKKTFKIYAC